MLCGTANNDEIRIMMKEKVLFISSRPIYPIVGGDQIRTVQQLEFLVQRYDVDVLYMDENEGYDVVKKYLPEVRNVYRFHVPKLKCYWQTLRFLFNSLPLQVNYYQNKRMKRFVAEHLNEYDIVFCNNIRTAEYVRQEKCSVRKCIDFVDAISMNYVQAIRQAHGLKKLIYWIDSRRCMRYEADIIKTFDCCAIISEVDKQFILNYGKNNPRSRK